MKKTLLFFISILANVTLNAQDAYNLEFITIKGTVRDYECKPLDSVLIEIKHPDFSTAFKTLTDVNGHYELQVEKGKYMALLAIKQSEYPSPESLLPLKDQRLEFWCWNLIADEDLTIDIKYHRLEIYGLNVFRVYGAAPGYTIYCRPMSLSRAFSKPEKVLLCSSFCPDLEETLIKVSINAEPVSINLKEKVREFVAEDVCYGFLLHVDMPHQLSNKPFDILKIEMLDQATSDRGEAIYFIEKPGYQ